jgi:predicted acetyltransferase
MRELVPPTTEVHASFLAAMAEFAAEGRGGPEDDSMIGREVREYGAVWGSPEGFAAYVGHLVADADEDHPRPDGWVPCTTRWLVSGRDYLARIAIRHRLTPYLLEVGGHIGYDTRPSARRRGHATEMLSASLPIARDLGIDAVLVTCDADNSASRRVIEANGGVLEDQRGPKLRFWITTA